MQDSLQFVLIEPNAVKTRTAVEYNVTDHDDLERNTAIWTGVFASARQLAHVELDKLGERDPERPLPLPQAQSSVPTPTASVCISAPLRQTRKMSGLAIPTYSQRAAYSCSLAWQSR